MAEGMTFKKLGFRFRILQLREFSTPMKVGGFGVDIGGWNCFAAATGEPIETRHIAAVEVRDWLFRKGVTYLYGEAAEELVAQAKREGVYIKGDPGENQNDRKVTSEPVYATSSSGSNWYTYASTSSTTTTWFTYGATGTNG